jgi:hypothetical protein
MQPRSRITLHHTTRAGLFRHLASVFNRRAAEQLRTGRNPEQAAQLAAEYSRRAQALEPRKAVQA